jgi:pseudouridine-5'-phosphate glycosidase
MICAAMAGISVFATGGIGGVHKGAEKSFDISADLDELARTPVIVVSAGAKAILDIEKTLEVLETRGVPVIGNGSEVMPAFWSRQSPYRAPLVLDSPEKIARLTRRAGRSGWRAACWWPTRCRRTTRSRRPRWPPISTPRRRRPKRRPLSARR